MEGWTSDDMTPQGWKSYAEASETHNQELANAVFAGEMSLWKELFRCPRTTIPNTAT